MAYGPPQGQPRNRPGRFVRPSPPPSGLGFVDPATVAAAASIVKGLIGGNTAAADPTRLAANEKAFALAQAGNADAVAYLRGRSGQYGAVRVATSLGLPDTPGTVSGWAGTVGRPDAVAKLAALGAGGPSGQASGPVPAVYAPPIVGGPGGPATASVGGSLFNAIPLPLLALGAGISVWAATRRKGRR